MNMTPENEIILYAKHWYKETDLFEDLKKILGEIYWYDMSKNDVVEVVTRVTSKAINEKNFTEFIRDVHSESFWKFTRATKEADYYTRVVCKCLSVLALLDKEKVEEYYGFKLQKPNFKVLPPSREFKEGEIDSIFD